MSEFVFTNGETPPVFSCAPRQFDFTPQPDITALESAWIALFFVRLPWLTFVDSFEQWSLISRHFTEVARQ